MRGIAPTRLRTTPAVQLAGPASLRSAVGLFTAKLP
jgi:hypothetical protein